jgi:eukaryotic-like serine/threonine-protein kinase
MSDQINVPLEQGTLLHEGKYEIIKVLGKGNFGVVYQACDKRGAGKLVAIKQMPMQMIVDCERQADLRVMLTHPAIPRIYDCFVVDASSYLVQDLIEGWNLEQVLAEHDDFLSAETVIAWAIQLCDVLNYLHNHPHYPMVFRDLKPNNIMTDYTGKIYLVDFGLARIYPPRYFQEPQPQFAHLQRGLALGTEGYSAPEQYEGLAEPRSDIYALGATMHHLLTRRDPRKETPFSFAEYPVRSINAAVSPGLETVVMKALNRDMEQRFSTATEMQLALEALLI